MNRNLLHGLLDSTSAIALDMCGTFMFGHDRFGPDEQYGRTYRSLGSTTLSDDRVRAAIIACFRTMNTIYEDIAPSRFFSQRFVDSRIAGRNPRAIPVRTVTA
jgi:hypothetical protein